MNKSLSTTALAAALMVLAAVPATAATVTLDFGSEANQAYVLEYFNGGLDSHGNGGANDGVEFGANAESLTAGVSGARGTGTGKFENLPGSAGAGVLLFAAQSSSGALAPANVINVAQGFTNVAFDYSIDGNLASYAGGTVTLWSGANGTGTSLGSFTLAAAATTTACGTSGDLYCNWQNASLAASGVAQSLSVSGNAVTYSEFAGLQVTEVPLPGALLLLLSGLTGIAGFMRRRPTAA